MIWAHLVGNTDVRKGRGEQVLERRRKFSLPFVWNSLAFVLCWAHSFFLKRGPCLKIGASRSVQPDALAPAVVSTVHVLYPGL